MSDLERQAQGAKPASSEGVDADEGARGAALHIRKRAEGGDSEVAGWKPMCLVAKGAEDVDATCCSLR